MRKQCAWCLIDLDTGIPLAEKDFDASHGICDKCFAVTMRALRRDFQDVVSEAYTEHGGEA